MKRVLVTGGAGFIGSHLVDALVARGRAVSVLDDFSSGRRANLGAACARGNVRVVAGSVLDGAKVDAALSDCDSVYHLAVQCVRRSLSRPLENHAINATGTINVLDAARRHGIRRFVYCSSSEVYGNASAHRLSETETVCAPTTVYGAAKLAGEHYALAYHRVYGLPVVVVRPFNCYGPRAHEDGDLAEVIPRFLIRVLNGLPPVIFGDGGQGRDFTYIGDTVRGLIAAADSDAAVGRTINLARGELVRIDAIAQTVLALCRRDDLAIEFAPARPGDVYRLNADTALARTLLGFAAEVDIVEGLGRYLDWFTAAHYGARPAPDARVVNWEMPPV